MWVSASLESCCEVCLFPGLQPAHSAKATVLSWLAKYGVDEDSRTVLGHHVGKSKTGGHLLKRFAVRAIEKDDRGRRADPRGPFGPV